MMSVFSMRYCLKLSLTQGLLITHRKCKFCAVTEDTDCFFRRRYDMIQ